MRVKFDANQEYQIDTVGTLVDHFGSKQFRKGGSLDGVNYKAVIIANELP